MMITIDKTGYVEVITTQEITTKYELNIADYLPKIEFCVNAFLSEDVQYHDMTVQNVYDLCECLDVRANTVIAVNKRRIKTLHHYVIELLSNLAQNDDNLVAKTIYAEITDEDD